MLERIASVLSGLTEHVVVVVVVSVLIVKFKCNKLFSRHFNNLSICTPDFTYSIDFDSFIPFNRLDTIRPTIKRYCYVAQYC